MKVLDLFMGRGGWSRPFRERGHQVIGLDLESRFGAELTVDILTWDPSTLRFHPDVILASPPCTAFTVMQIGTNWTKYHTPKTEGARLGLAILNQTVEVIQQLAPTYWWLENPMGKMRRMPILRPFRRATVTYCQYHDGDKRTAKPTDLWGVWPSTWTPKPRCYNGDPCHIEAPAGSRTGTQSEKSSEEIAEVEYGLALSVCLACEQALAGVKGPQRTLAEVAT